MNTAWWHRFSGTHRPHQAVRPGPNETALATWLDRASPVPQPTERSILRAALEAINLRRQPSRCHQIRRKHAS
jgi:hypothetical protein